MLSTLHAAELTAVKVSAEAEAAVELLSVHTKTRQLSGHHNCLLTVVL